MTKLTVEEAVQMDVGRNIARIPRRAMESLGVAQGDAIFIKGKVKIAAQVYPIRSEDESKDIIRMDGNMRMLAQSSLSTLVEIAKAQYKDAKSITLAPIEGSTFFADQNFFKSRFEGYITQKNSIITVDYMGRQGFYTVVKVSPAGVVRLSAETKIQISEKPVKEIKTPNVSYEDIGGLSREIELVREMVEIPMKHPEVFDRLGISSPKGVLMTGPPGTGKTLLAKAVASETDSAFYSIAGPEIMSKFYGESEKQLREIFEEAEKNAPAIIFIDEIDSIAPKREETRDQTEKRIVAQLLTIMDGLKSRGQVIVMAATNRPDDLDEALRRPGRFDRELKIHPPGLEGRKEILHIHSRGMPLAEDLDMDDLAHRTNGFTGADIEVLCKEAAMRALRPWMPSLQDQAEKVPANVLDKIQIKKEHFDHALTVVEPSAMREVLINTPTTTWDDVGGLGEAKQLMKEAIELPLKKPELFKKAGIKPPKGILLHGPPGTGKTLIAKAIAHESNANFISIKGPELISKWVGESEKRVRDIFKKARQVAPAIIFFDEFDAISQVRGSSTTDSTERMVNQLLTELDGVESLEKVTIVAATNRPDLIDPSLLRPGRIDVKIEIGLPDDATRKQIFEVHTKGMPLKDVQLDDYIAATTGMSGAEIENICREAGMAAIRRVADTDQAEVVITKTDFDDALKIVKKI
ncbi:CDC48 family AAA ATPase [Candidatus Woesearchaeota archaeon]|nr:CDC48 family AAA ATPase [Candidatus Woesearchaeota archaeon]